MLMQEAVTNFSEGRIPLMQAPAPEADQGVYGITVAAHLVGLGAQNLRLYEARGLLQPDRTEGGTRRYSANDLARLRLCAADDCTDVLVDLSRNKSKRYCDTGNCGNRTNVAAYRARKRTA